jgi:hypothetical protein
MGNRDFMTPKLAGSTWFLLAGLAASSLLVVLVFVRYPGHASTKTAHFGSMLLALLLILAVTVFVGWSGARVRPPEKAADTNVGLIIGLITGCAWVLEISFNNFVDPSVSTAGARYVVAHRLGDPAGFLRAGNSTAATRSSYPGGRVERADERSNLVLNGAAYGDRMDAILTARPVKHP